MNNFGKFASAIVAAVALFALGVFAFVWVFCRVYVGPGEMAIVTSKTGDELPPGAILAEPGQKGVQRIPLGEGRHFLDPVTHDWRIVAAITIPAGSVGVVTSKNGRELAPGEILAPDRDSKGVWKDVLGPGRYRLNPEGYDVKVMSAINIPIGYVGVVTSQTGKPAAAGSFAGPGEKGVMEKVLQPGLYYVNPRAYQVDVVEIGMNQVSIVGKSGTVVLTKAQSQSANGLDELQRMTLQKQVQKRAEYVTQNADLGIVDEDSARNFSNYAQSSLGSLSRAPVARKVAAAGAVDRKMKVREEAAMPAQQRAPVVQSQLPANDSVAFGMNQFVQFPSSDGFAIMLDMTVEFELMPEKISKIFMLYGDLPAVVSKIIMPQILSISRMKGSDYKAREFIDGEGRQKFQEEMTAELVRVLGEKHILVRNAIVRHVEVPEEILAPIQSQDPAGHGKAPRRAQYRNRQGRPAQARGRAGDGEARCDGRRRDEEGRRRDKRRDEAQGGGDRPRVREDSGEDHRDARLRRGQGEVPRRERGGARHQAPRLCVQGSVALGGPHVCRRAQPRRQHPRDPLRRRYALDRPEGRVPRGSCEEVSAAAPIFALFGIIAPIDV